MDKMLVDLNAVLRPLVIVLALVGGVRNLVSGVWLIWGEQSLRRGVLHLALVVIVALVLMIVL